jgi:hypothetical protein
MRYVYMVLPGLALWYFYYSVECTLNGGTLGRNQWLMAFQCYYQELLWNIPGQLGINNRLSWIHEFADNGTDGVFITKDRIYTYAEIRMGDPNCVDAYARAILPGKLHCILVLLIPLLIGYLISYIISYALFR